ncbi:MFS transporter [Calderihabitans maritimus]|uniref:EmrB/QacA subfamily drug resistance transporter n=1 Tax=Calderihabitans maritimus TaxID=1246530 RepID=A0A1Z5HNM8_9FIRM|nr:MFS transporter [Calderihabitans maritimus]GAW91123.1 EmrB/QacA subfamily drug resistance transporter [Calderihabitans maritimus]
MRRWSRLLGKIKHSSSQRWWVLANVSVGTFMATLDSSIVNVALPTIGKELYGDVNRLQWVVTGYLVTIASLLLVFGRLSDMVGRKKVYSTGFFIFTGSSTLCSMAQNVGQLVVFRVLQGFGAAMLMANTLALVTQVFPEEERGRALGISGMVVSAGSLTGPALGGILVGTLGWRAIFWVNVPVGLLGSILSYYVLPSGGVGRREKLDWVGALTFAVGINSLLFLSFQVSEQGWNGRTFTLLLISILSYGLFYIIEKRTQFPLVDLTLFQNRVFLVGNGARLLIFVAVAPVMFLLPFYLQLVQHLSPQQVGAVMTAFPLAMAVTAPLSGRLSDYLSPRPLTVIGPLVQISGLLLLAGLITENSLIVIPVGLALLGMGMGIFQVPNNTLVMGSVPDRRLSIANALISVMRNIGTILGVGVAVLIFNWRGAADAMVITGNAGPAWEAGVMVRTINSALYFSLLIVGLTALLVWKGYRRYKEA